MAAELANVPLVDIDAEGRFKYVLIKVHAKVLADGSEPNKLIVRGFRSAEWHGTVSCNACDFMLRWCSPFCVCLADIYDAVSKDIETLGLATECLGGGRIEHFPDAKKLKVYGHSTVSRVLTSSSSSFHVLFIL